MNLVLEQRSQRQNTISSVMTMFSMRNAHWIMTDQVQKESAHRVSRPFFHAPILDATIPAATFRPVTDPLGAAVLNSCEQRRQRHFANL